MSDTLPISRSDFLRGGFRSLFEYAADTASEKVRKGARTAVVPLLRPPGAVAELEFLANCTRCDACFDACPHGALQRAPVKYGAAVDMPVLEPSAVPCYLCEDFPCIDACRERALQPVERVNIGTAHIVPNKCFVYNGQRCDYCYAHCPEKDTAIRMENGKPFVIAESCNGCGMCEYLCPAPEKAVTVIPDR